MKLITAAGISELLVIDNHSLDQRTIKTQPRKPNKVPEL